MSGGGLTAEHWKANTGQAWSDLAPLMERMNLPVWQAVVDNLRPTPGDHVVDIGCGAGATTIDMARRVAPGGRCVGVDVSPTLLATARQAAEGVAGAAFVEADAETYPFEPASFDALVSRFGVMFFADPVAAFANMRRGVKPQGRLAFACWRGAADNPYALIPVRAAAPFLPPPAAQDPLAPGRFAFADRERVRSILENSGWREVEVAPLDVPTPVSFDELMDLSLKLGSLAPRLREESGAVRTRVHDAVAEALQPHVVGGLIPLSAACWLVTARA